LPGSLSDVFVTAAEIPPRAHVLTQAAFQEHVDSAISKTINFSAEATRHEVNSVFRLASRRQCKGITIYRIDSRTQQALASHSGLKSLKGGCRCGTG
jgi:ribonucleoside-diphosphate reductase alpha chain